MIETINAFFNIKTAVSAPIVITLLVFITGWIFNLIIHIIKKISTNRRARLTFKFLIKQTVKELKQKEKQTKTFYSTLNIYNSGNWGLVHKPLSYLETFDKLNYMETYLASRKKCILSLSNKVKEKAFHKTWSIIKSLDFVENKINPDLDKMIIKYQEYHNAYNSSLEKLYQEYENIREKNNNKKLDENYYFFLIELDVIVNYWTIQNQTTSRTFYNTHEMIVKQIILLLEKHQRNVDINKFSKPALDCVHQFNQMDTVLKTYKDLFKSNYFLYRKHRITLNKIIDIL